MTRRLAPSPWMQTASGKAFDLLYPRPRDVDLADLAPALAKLCRYGGHCASFYSVAQHCIEVANLLPHRLRFYGLLHDAHEAYVGDILRPVKIALDRLGAGEGWAELVGGLDAAIHRHFGLAWPLAPEDISTIRHADLVMLATERRDLLDYRLDWNGGAGGEYLPAPAPHAIRPWPWPMAADKYQAAVNLCIAARELREAGSH